MSDSQYRSGQIVRVKSTGKLFTLWVRGDNGSGVAVWLGEIYNVGSPIIAALSENAFDPSMPSSAPLEQPPKPD